ncbi:MAG: metallophosphoesterase family protein [Deltaproteobacteria bacterium]|nr:metallophosphoesterase family protein [Deltaproteobacteria bacterium]
MDLLVYGHTHQKEMSFKEGMLVINHGAVCGVLSEGKTVAVFDSDQREVKHFEIT